jgi:cobalt/nickel transport system permease protein
MAILDHPSMLTRGHSLVDRVDPRSRIVGGVAFSVFVAVSARLSTLLLALAAAVLAALVARLRPQATLARLASLNGFMLLLAIVLPWSVRGTPLVHLGPLAYSREGLLLAATVAIKGNAIVLMLMVLVGTLDVAILGHALEHLYVPQKLAHLLLFTVRYLEILERQYRQLSAAMRVRGFRPRMDWHTYRSYGYLVGMLLVRSLDRSEGVLSAMKCRGFRGRFYLLDHFAFSAADVRFAILGLGLLVGLAGVEWMR